MTKNLSWEISTKNLVTFKRWDGVNDKKILILWEFTGKSGFYFFLGGKRCMKKNFLGDRGLNPLKRGAWIVCRFKRGIGKRRGHVIEARRG